MELRGRKGEEERERRYRDGQSPQYFLNRRLWRTYRLSPSNAIISRPARHRELVLSMLLSFLTIESTCRCTMKQSKQILNNIKKRIT